MEAILVVVALVVMSTSVFDFLHPPYNYTSVWVWGKKREGMAFDVIEENGSRFSAYCAILQDPGARVTYYSNLINLFSGVVAVAIVADVDAARCRLFFSSSSLFYVAIGCVFEAYLDLFSLCLSVSFSHSLSLSASSASATQSNLFEAPLIVTRRTRTSNRVVWI